MRDLLVVPPEHVAGWRGARYQRRDQGRFAGGYLAEYRDIDVRGLAAAVEFAQLATKFLNAVIGFAQPGDTRLE